MKIGEKIRELRIAKMMTQSDLAGTKITRNMLSCIENGSASPSLSTVQYLAERLKVPVGLLFGDDEETELYRKLMQMPNIRGAYANGDYDSCRALCEAAFETPDDEMCLMLTDCCMHMGIEKIEEGNLHAACDDFDSALRYAEETVYPTEQYAVRIDTYFRYLAMISGTLYSNVLGDDGTALTDTGELALYLSGLDALSNENWNVAEKLLPKLPEGSFYVKHLEIRLQMYRSLYEDAKKELFQLLNSSDYLHKTELFFIFTDLESCCRETEDFRGAYLYANEKMELLEQLLRTE